MPKLVSDVLTTVGYTLTDTSNTRWTAAEIRGYINLAQHEIVAAQPAACTSTASVLLAAGVKQSLPTGSYLLIDVTRNLGTTGTAAGTAIRPTTMTSLAAFLPGWASVTSSATVKHYMYNKEADQSTFYVYPPQPAASRGYVEMVTAVLPTDVAANGDALSVGDDYYPAVVAYVLFKCWSKDAEDAANLEQAAGYYKQFQGLLAAKGGGESTVGGDNG